MERTIEIKRNPNGPGVECWRIGNRDFFITAEGEFFSSAIRDEHEQIGDRESLEGLTQREYEEFVGHPVDPSIYVWNPGA